MAHIVADPDFDIERLSVEHEIGRVVVAHGELEPPVLLELLRRCKELSIKVSVLPQISDAMGPSVELDDVAGLTTVLAASPRERAWSRSSWHAGRPRDRSELWARLASGLPALFAPDHKRHCVPELVGSDGYDLITQRKNLR